MVVVEDGIEFLGPEIELRYAWMTEHYTFLLTVTVSTAVLPKYGEPLRQLLESIEMISL